jgi:hypothetical protein
VQGTVGFIGLVVGVIAAILSAIWSGFPSLRPDPGERAEATITNDAVDEQVTQGEFFLRTSGNLPSNCTSKQLERRGNVCFSLFLAPV